jgi:hypothetical protein
LPPIETTDKPFTTLLFPTHKKYFGAFQSEQHPSDFYLTQPKSAVPLTATNQQYRRN